MKLKKQIELLSETVKDGAQPKGKPLTDLYQQGRMGAYSHVWFELQPILKEAGFVESDRRFRRIDIPMLCFCIGVLLGIYITCFILN